MGKIGCLAASVLIPALAAHATIIDNFDGQSTGTWSSQSQSIISTISDPSGNAGNHVLSWVYRDIGIDWSNEVKLSLSATQDWTTASYLSFKLEAGAVTATNRRIGVYVINNGQKADFGQQSVQYDSTTGYETVNLSLTSPYVAGVTFNRVSLIAFYVYGGYYTNGDSQFYIDDISIDTAAVPEPAALPWLALACATTACLRKPMHRM